ncbi:MAG: phosphoribosyltransferase family protein [Nautiliaceae bacterium]
MIFKNRFDAGIKLSEVLDLPQNSVIFAIPRGGVPVGYAIAVNKKVPMDIVVVRKLPIPFNPEAGFGSITVDGKVILNPNFEYLFSQIPIDSIAREVLSEVKRRDFLYRKNAPYKDLTGKTAVVVDDGFASGYSAIAAYEMLKKYNPQKIIAIAPVCPSDTKKLLENYFDEVYCLIESEKKPFAVASFYQDFHDLSDDEILEIIEDLKEKKLLWSEYE